MKNRKRHENWVRQLPTLYESCALEELPDRLLKFLAQAIPADVSAYNEVDLRRQRARVAIDPPELNGSPYLRVFESFMDQHPLITHQQRTGDPSAHCISEFLSRPAFHRTPLYNEVYRHIGGEDQIALSLLLSPTRIVALAFNRRLNFAASDRESLNRLQPHLIQAYRNAETVTALQNELHTLRELTNQLALGILALNQRGRIVFATCRARSLLRKYFPDARGGQLPLPVAAWLRTSCHFAGQPLPNACRDFSITNPGGRLTLRRVAARDSSEILLKLEEDRVPLSSRRLETLGLTPRQAEVLLWLDQGKSNPEIAVILGTATKTVQKHLEAVFARLGVETRTTAALRALEVLNSDGH